MLTWVPHSVSPSKKRSSIFTGLTPNKNNFNLKLFPKIKFSCSLKNQCFCAKHPVGTSRVVHRTDNSMREYTSSLFLCLSFHSFLPLSYNLSLSLSLSLLFSLYLSRHSSFFFSFSTTLSPLLSHDLSLFLSVERAALSLAFSSLAVLV